jgi:hypothetical protein
MEERAKAFKHAMLIKFMGHKEDSIEWDAIVALCDGETDRLKQADIIANMIWEKASTMGELQINPIEFEIKQVEGSIRDAISSLHFGFISGKTKTIEQFKNDWFSYRESRDDGNLVHLAYAAYEHARKAQDLSILLEKYLMLKGLSNVTHKLTMK